MEIIWRAVSDVMLSSLNAILHCVPEKHSHFYFLNNFVKNEPILIIFGTLYPEGTWH